MAKKPVRHNPKKDKTARRQRPPRNPAGAGRIRMSMERAIEGLLNAPADIAPMLACAAVWMWNAAEDGHAGNHCVDAVMIMHFALDAFGISSHPEPVRVALIGNGSETLYGAEVPHWTQSGEFNGHVVLAVPETGRFVDATLQQFREVPHSEHGEIPLIAKLPGANSMGSTEFAISRVDHEVIYIPIPGEHKELWQHPTVANALDGYRNAGINLAGNVFDMLRLPDIRDRALSGPYPRLRHLVEVLGDAPSVAREGGYYFRHPKTGLGVRLSDVP